MKTAEIIQLINLWNWCEEKGKNGNFFNKSSSYECFCLFKVSQSTWRKKETWPKWNVHKQKAKTNINNISSHNWDARHYPQALCVKFSLRISNLLVFMYVFHTCSLLSLFTLNPSNSSSFLSILKLMSVVSNIPLPLWEIYRCSTNIFFISRLTHFRTL